MADDSGDFEESAENNEIEQNENRNESENETKEETETPIKKRFNDRLCLKGWIAEYIEYTKNQASPQTFHTWTAVSILSAALRRNVWIDRQGYFNIYPNMYIMLIAPQGKCHKSTAAKMGVRMLRAMQDIRMMLEKVTPEGLIAYLAGDIGDDGKGYNVKGGGSKGESGKIVKQVLLPDGKNFTQTEESNVFIFASELSTLIGSASYTETLIENFVNMYDCPDEGEYTTKSGGKRQIPNVCVNILGCSTPIWLAKGLKEEGVSGGFAGRIIFVYKDSGGKKISLLGKKHEGMDDHKIKLIHDLMKIKELKGEFVISSGGIDFYERWLQSYNPDMTGRLAAYYERKPDHILKLSMILAVNEADDLIISARHMQMAIDMLEEQEKQMPKAFTFVGATNEARVSQLIMDMINAYPAKFVSYKRLLGNARHLLKNKREFDDIMEMLITSGHVKMFSREGMRYFTVDDNLVNYLREVEAVAEADAKREVEEVQKAREEKVRIDNIKNIVDEVLAGPSTETTQ